MSRKITERVGGCAANGEWTGGKNGEAKGGTCWTCGRKSTRRLMLPRCRSNIQVKRFGRSDSWKLFSFFLNSDLADYQLLKQQ